MSEAEKLWVEENPAAGIIRSFVLLCQQPNKWGFETVEQELKRP